MIFLFEEVIGFSRMFTTKTSPTVTPSSPWTKGKAGAVIAEIRSSPCTQQHGAGREKLIFFEKRKTLWLCSGLFISFHVLQRMHRNRCPPKESPKCLLVRNHWVLRPPICETPIGFCLPTANAGASMQGSRIRLLFFRELLIFARFFFWHSNGNTHHFLRYVQKRRVLLSKVIWAVVFFLLPHPV